MIEVGVFEDQVYEASAHEGTIADFVFSSLHKLTLLKTLHVVAERVVISELRVDNLEHSGVRLRTV